jgi:gamma-glutamyltranspeptidase/glutathione hydrolase
VYHAPVRAPTRWREARGAHGAVATPHALASDSGLAILERGGNALDAAIAAAATIAVVYPHMNGVGGDNFWLVYDARRRRLTALNAAGRAAAAADAATYRARFGAIPVRGGPAALTVPGAVSGWGAAHEYSRTALASPIRWHELLGDAVRFAMDGFPPSAGQRRVTRAARDLFDAAPDEVRRTLWPIYHPDRLAAERFRQPDLARTLETLAREGADAFYRGSIARRVAEAATAVASPLGVDDLARHRADWVEPLSLPYRRGVAASLPPPTQGFAALAILGVVEAFDVSRLDDADHVHVVVEATKLALDDRDRYLADPAVVPVPVETCLDRERLAERARQISLDRGSGDGPARPASGDTIAIVTADGAGNAVCVIQSLYHEFGSGVVAGDTGVLLQNRGAFFSLDPAHPNCLAPGKRPAHTLIPSMYLVEGHPRLVYGTMGGDGQPQTQAALVTRIVDRGFSPQEAVEAPRWLYGRTWGQPSRALRLEGRFDPGVAESLRGRGHDVRVVEAWSDLMGHAQLIAWADDEWLAASDPRADGAARAL